MSAAQAAAPAWVTKSDGFTKERLELEARFGPEAASRTGLEGYDDKIMDLTPGFRERFRTALRALTERYREALKGEQDASIRQDLEILIDSAERSLQTRALYEKRMIDYYNLPQAVFYAINTLIDPQVAKGRQPAALVRLRKYTGLEEGFTAIFEHAKRETSADLKESALIGPYVKELEKDLANVPRFVAGLRELFAGSEIKGWEAAVAEFEKQAESYVAWLRKNLLPRARQES